MRLSEAIRLGAMDHPQAFGEFIGEEGSRCALQSAALALGCESVPLRSPYGSIIDTLAERYPFLIALKYPGLPNPMGCPMCDTPTHDIARTICHLNDHHHLTREQIADWVQTIEEREAATVAPAPDVVAVPESAVSIEGA